jgi:uncharacterized iron-regulated membrane protein
MQEEERDTKKKSNAKLWFLVHSWLALPIWIFVFFICLTGSIATVSSEIVWLFDPAVRANQPADDAPLLSYDAILKHVSDEQPGVAVRSISRPVKSQYALTVGVTYPDGTSTSLYVNPYTGHVQGKAAEFNFQQFIRALHGWLLMPFKGSFNLAWYAVTFVAFPMLLSLITGLVVYKRFWRGYFNPKLRFTHGSRVFWGDFHRLAGIWSVPFIAIISVTSIWFFTLALLADNRISFSTVGPPIIIAREDVPVVKAGEPAPMIGLDRAAEIAHETFPDLNPTFVSLPGNAYSPISVGGRGAYPLIFETLQINPYNGNVERARRVSDRSTFELITDSMRPLHTGDFAGLWLKLVYFFFGILLTMMVLSGVLIWMKRTVKKTKVVKRAVRQKKSVQRRSEAVAEPASALAGGEHG